ncbi:MAG: hypothetical protein V2A73_22240, partial [Pseudomonadota bacterium]
MIQAQQLPLKHLVCWLGLGAVAALAACSRTSLDDDDAVPATEKRSDSRCPRRTIAPDPLSGIEAKHLSLERWLEWTGRKHDLDEVLLSSDEIADLNASLGVSRPPIKPQIDLRSPIDPQQIVATVAERVSSIRSQLESGSLVLPGHQALSREEDSALAQRASITETRPAFRIAVAPIQVRCAPFALVLQAREENGLDPSIDRNSCGSVRPQEALQPLAEWPNGMVLVRTRFGIGWIDKSTSLALAIPPEAAAPFLAGPYSRLASQAVLRAGDSSSATLPAGTLVPSAKNSVVFATSTGLHHLEIPPSDGLTSTRRPLTRRMLLEEAWRALGLPFGFGDQNGGRDCSRTILDILESFAIRLPRHSAW